MTGLTYKESGVDIEAGDEFVDGIRGMSLTTLVPGVLTQIGGFAGHFELPTGYENPVLVTSTDGVGTKLELAKTRTNLMGIGCDLVAMVVNDLLCSGAKPLFFLDYYATGHLDPGDAKAVITGVADACRESEMALIGGETAEMPGVYGKGKFDVAGFGVGIVEKSEIINGAMTVKSGDALVGIASSGPHSNGFSLIRNVLQYYAPHDGDMMIELLQPTRIYHHTLNAIRAYGVDIHGIAHITGGGMTNNIPRMMDSYYKAVIKFDEKHSAWYIPDCFRFIQKHGMIADEEMLRVFNMGIGMVVAVPQEHVDIAIDACLTEGHAAWHIGNVGDRHGTEPQVQYRNG